MSQDSSTPIAADLVKNLLSEEGYEVIPGEDENLFHVRDLESGMRITCALEENILYNTLPCYSTAEGNITLEFTRLLLDGENGITTSSFNLYNMPDGQVRVALNNFCKLQDLGPEDRDDILSCITFLLIDVVAARSLLSEFL